MTLIALLLLAAQTTPATTPPPAPPKVDCTDADHTAFDFWIGEWDVYAGTTKVARSRIEKIVGCAISETYDQTIGPGNTPVDYHGRSISSYVQPDKVWRQFYTDNAGTAATLTGGFTGGAMVFTSRAGPLTNRMTVSPNPDGSVTQRGEFSTDDGKTWQPAYDFTYRKRTAT